MTAVYDVSHVAIYWKEQGMRSKLAILLAVGALMLVMTAATAYAENLLCQVGIACNGTPKGDVLTGTSQSDQIKGLGGRDRINDSSGNDIDTIAGGAENDTIDVREGNSSINNRDLVDCGKGARDRVFFDTGDNGDKVARCEIKNP
jgi:Ca2+-binding RTX toxin-like protein